jgi:cell division protease FtsH
VTARIIDEEVGRILDEQAERAAAALARHRPALDALAAALLEHESLDAADVVVLAATAGHPPGPRGDDSPAEGRGVAAVAVGG